MSDEPKRLELKATIQSFAELRENWNSYGAGPLHQSLIDKAKDVVDWLPDFSKYKWQAVPGESFIQIESHTNGHVIEIYIAES